jgi:hypothetical protein
MTNKMYGALVASLSVAALMLAANETFAGPAVAHRGSFASTRTAFHPPAIRSLRHHRMNNAGIFWPGVGGYDYEPSGGEPPVGAAPPSGDTHYTYTYDVPWDWAHRYPPTVTPSDRPYVSSCPEETVKVPGRDGNEQTVNVMRCY